MDVTGTPSSQCFSPDTSSTFSYKNLHTPVFNPHVGGQIYQTPSPISAQQQTQLVNSSVISIPSDVELPCSTIKAFSFKTPAPLTYTPAVQTSYSQNSSPMMVSCTRPTIIVIQNDSVAAERKAKVKTVKKASTVQPQRQPQRQSPDQPVSSSNQTAVPRQIAPSPFMSSPVLNTPLSAPVFIPFGSSQPIPIKFVMSNAFTSPTTVTSTSTIDLSCSETLSLHDLTDRLVELPDDIDDDEDIDDGHLPTLEQLFRPIMEAELGTENVEEPSDMRQTNVKNDLKKETDVDTGKNDADRKMHETNAKEGTNQATEETSENNCDTETSAVSRENDVCRLTPETSCTETDNNVTASTNAEPFSIETLIRNKSEISFSDSPGKLEIFTKSINISKPNAVIDTCADMSCLSEKTLKAIEESTRKAIFGLQGANHHVSIIVSMVNQIGNGINDPDRSANGNGTQGQNNTDAPSGNNQPIPEEIQSKIISSTTPEQHGDSNDETEISSAVSGTDSGLSQGSSVQGAGNISHAQSQGSLMGQTQNQGEPRSRSALDLLAHFAPVFLQTSTLVNPQQVAQETTPTKQLQPLAPKPSSGAKVNLDLSCFHKMPKSTQTPQSKTPPISSPRSTPKKIAPKLVVLKTPQSLPKKLGPRKIAPKPLPPGTEANSQPINITVSPKKGKSSKLRTQLKHKARAILPKNFVVTTFDTSPAKKAASSLVDKAKVQQARGSSLPVITSPGRGSTARKNLQDNASFHETTEETMLCDDQGKQYFLTSY